ncbi:MAG: Helix-turn-helix domain [Solirubrobacteraceae bacterium]|nr:Helix-turn-helix domain [Solirubrobacteraceae bacterium]
MLVRMATTVDQTDRSNPQLLRPDEVATILQVTPRTVRRWGAAGILERIRLGDRLTRYTVESVEALIHPSTSNADMASVGVAKSDVRTSRDACSG